MSLEFVEMAPFINYDINYKLMFGYYNLFGPVHLKDIQCKSRSLQKGCTPLSKHAVSEIMFARNVH